MSVTELPHRALAGPGQAEVDEDGEPAAPGVPRWRPTRAGILNIWRYYDETFEFHRGRLLLRGPNGTGKSKALELLLPYLFDASLRASRLSTFATGERTMHWNMMGEGATGVTRVGYVWLEFGAAGGAADGPELWFCCGARLQATGHTTTVTPDYFTTSQRIGQPGGLALTTEAGQPLTKAALVEAIGDAGVVHPSANEYRTAIRTTLFPGLSEQRYDALITALLQLRTPKLSERLDPGLLSALLSRALPPLGHAEITELAEGFERLDRQRDQVLKLDAEVQAAEVIAARTQGYVQRALRAAAATLVSATSELDKLTRAARESEEKYQQAVAGNARAKAAKATLDGQAEVLSARIDGLTNSESYTKGRELDRLRQQAADAGREAARRQREAAARQAEASADREQAGTARQAAESMVAGVDAAAADARRGADRAGMAGTYQELTAALATSPQLARQLLRAAVESRQGQIREVRQAVDDHDRAVRGRQDAEAELDHTRTDLATATAGQATAAARYDAALAEQADRLRRWAAGCAELVIADPEELAELAGAPDAVLEIVTAAVQEALRAIAGLESTATAERAAYQRERADLASELDRLRRDVDLPPPAPHTRTADRAAMAGEPLWRLVSFVDGVPEPAQAAVEAALQASGLLDAWVTPAGPVAVRGGAGGHDTFADAELAAPVSGRSLAEVLRPEPGAAVPAERIHRLLAAVGYGETLPAGPAAPAAAIGADGSWRLASATGSWAKSEAAHIGAAARQRARQRRIAELTEQVDRLDGLVAELTADLLLLAGRRQQVDAERRARPDHRHVEAAKRGLDRAEADVAARGDAVNRCLARLAEREQQVRTALRTLTGLAAERRLPAELAALEELDQAVAALRGIADLWLDAHLGLASARGAADAAEERADRSRRHAEDGEQDATEAAAKAASLRSTLEAVESTVGADYRAVLAEIGQLRGELVAAREESGALQDVLLALAGEIGSLDHQRSVDGTQRDAATAGRDAAAARFRHLGSGTLPADAGIELALSTSDGTRATLDAARGVAARWPNIPHAPKNLTDALGRLAEAVHDSRQVLSERAELELESDEDIQVFTATVDGVRVGAAGLFGTLRAERDRGREEITAAERELFDQTLTGDTRRHLAVRIRQAGELVDAMNARLERVRTASRVAVRLVWQVDPALPAGTRAARELLLKDPVRLTDADREALHRFFRDRIEEAKAANTAASWEQQLARVFDYTAWHQFVVKIDRANGAGWQLLTKKLHGALSGGEKAIALHLPLFAAVAAHYQSVPAAPRLILLDEVFVGVDATNRGQVFDLLSRLDLDLVLTSDHEWCTYRELDGIAIHQLITGSDGDDAVTTARFVWTGTALLADGGPEQAPTPTPELELGLGLEPG
ncbi:MAG TPA: TIGR02680 family protein [Mycobacteriales bacterium]|nr:TIGR02680 family protein [Mycobacteriales bacterium]